MGVVHCRICGGEINREKDAVGTWTQTAKNYYYHTSCYETWSAKKNDIHSDADDKLWKDATYKYLQQDMKIVVDFPKFNSQWNSLLKKKRTPKGIYFTVRYFYEVQHGEREKAQGGIGIVDFIYEEACTYWCERENICSNIVSQIEEQMKLAQEREVKVIRQPQKKRKKTTPTFEDIERMEGC